MIPSIKLTFSGYNFERKRLKNRLEAAACPIRGGLPLNGNISSRVLTPVLTLVNGVTERTYTKYGGGCAAATKDGAGAWPLAKVDF